MISYNEVIKLVEYLLVGEDYVTLTWKWKSPLTNIVYKGFVIKEKYEK